jgi:hypothetical protein
MAPLQQSDIHQVFSVWANMFPFPARKPSEWKILEGAYFSSLSKRMNREEFLLCAEKAQCISKGFVPSLDLIIGYSDESIRELVRKRNQLALTMDTRTRMSDEEAAEGLRNYAKLMELAQSGLRHDEMADEMERFVNQGRN